MSWLIRIAIGFVALIVLAIIAFQMFRVPLAERAFQAAVDRNMGRNAAIDLDDGLHVYLCGTGSPFPSNRAGPCIGVLAGDKSFIFDAGSGSIRNLMQMGFPIESLEVAYLTHLHSDHIDGMGELLLQAWIAGGRSEPLRVAGPVGTERVLNGFVDAYTIDRGYRIAHHGTEVAIPGGFGANAEEISLPLGPSADEIVYEDGEITVTVIRVDHAPIEPAFGYRVDYKDRSISLSGDTVYHPGFVAASEGVDLMLHEALDPEMTKVLQDALTRAERPRTATIMHDILDYHATPEDGARAAAQAGAKELVYYHIVPPLPVRALNAVWLGDAADQFDGKITVGEDGTLVSLPAGGDAIQYSRAY